MMLRGSNKEGAYTVSVATQHDWLASEEHYETAAHKDTNLI